MPHSPTRQNDVTDLTEFEVRNHADDEIEILLPAQLQPSLPDMLATAMLAPISRLRETSSDTTGSNLRRITVNLQRSAEVTARLVAVLHELADRCRRDSTTFSVTNAPLKLSRMIHLIGWEDQIPIASHRDRGEVWVTQRDLELETYTALTVAGSNETSGNDPIIHVPKEASPELAHDAAVESTNP